MGFENLIITGKISALERDIADIKEQMNPVNVRLKIAYEYKESLYDAMRQADENIKTIQSEYFALTCKIHEKLEKMQSELKIYVSSDLY